jgi:segregation and condensation protein B
MENVKAVIEALIFASDAPLSQEKIRIILPEVEKNEIKKALDKIILEYDERQSGIYLQEVAGGFQFRTRPELSSWVKKLKSTKPHSLSPQAMETLAIVAYKQPIVKSEIESIRGVDVGAPLKGLLDKKLIRIVGRKDVPGKPIIYGTTRKFLEVFNLKDLLDLPNLRELKELNQQQELVEQEIAEEDTTEDIPNL